jgi:hypothetical protein
MILLIYGIFIVGIIFRCIQYDIQLRILRSEMDHLYNKFWDMLDDYSTSASPSPSPEPDEEYDV